MCICHLIRIHAMCLYYAMRIHAMCTCHAHTRYVHTRHVHTHHAHSRHAHMPCICTINLQKISLRIFHASSKCQGCRNRGGQGAMAPHFLIWSYIVLVEWSIYFFVSVIIVSVIGAWTGGGEQGHHVTPQVDSGRAVERAKKKENGAQHFPCQWQSGLSPWWHYEGIYSGRVHACLCMCMCVSVCEERPHTFLGCGLKCVHARYTECPAYVEGA